jgi:polysaccharide pyruvyl transferase CsaB
VVISGYYGFRNSGDEAMLYAMLPALRSRIADLEVTVLSRDPAGTAGKFGITAVPRDSLCRAAGAIRRADLLISGGGGLLQDVTSLKSIVYYLGVVILAKLFRKPVFFYGQGVGPVRTALGRMLVKMVANRVDLITVRDADSMAELLGMGVTRPSLLVTADPVLGLDPALVDREKGWAILAGMGVKGRPVAGISVRSWKEFREYKKAVAEVADELSGEGWAVLLIPMHYPDDVGACREVAGLMKNRSFLFERPEDFLDILSVTANLDLAIGMRLHFLIFGAVFGVPLVGISYDPKVDRFLGLLGLQAGIRVESLDHKGLSRRVQQVLAGRTQMLAGMQERLAGLRREALRNAELAADLLNKNRKSEFRKQESE